MSAGVTIVMISGHGTTVKVCKQRLTEPGGEWVEEPAHHLDLNEAANVYVNSITRYVVTEVPAPSDATGG